MDGALGILSAIIQDSLDRTEVSHYAYPLKIFRGARREDGAPLNSVGNFFQST